ncbi:MAG: hypothetical protein H0U74_19515 [Bradymonadaceae bacterium]|nr:hypothetical protein [Lujinxingiaceae bacterium]
MNKHTIVILIASLSLIACSTDEPGGDAALDEDVAVQSDASSPEDVEAPDDTSADDIVQTPLDVSPAPDADVLDAANDVADVADEPDVVVVPPYDLSEGTWHRENVSQSENTFSGSQQLAFLSDGTAWVAWSRRNPDSQAPSDDDIWVAKRTGTSWAIEPHTVAAAAQMTYPSLSVVDDVVHLALSGYPFGNQTVYYSKNEGAGFSANVDLTTVLAQGVPRRDFHPVINAAPSGGFAVAYQSQSLTGADVRGPSQIHVLRFTDASAPQGPELAIDWASPGCLNHDAVFDANGHLHIVASCGNALAPTLVYATDASGSWQQSQPAPGTGRYAAAPSLALDPDGTTLHVAWAGSPLCSPDTTQSCGEIYYQRVENGAFSRSVSVSNTDTEREHVPAIGVDANGLIIVAFHRFNENNIPGIFVTWTDGTKPFSDARNISPDTADLRDQSPASIRFHPESGHPHLLYRTTFPGTQPLRTEVFHAYWAPQ